jgi:hypothetical protein
LTVAIFREPQQLVSHLQNAFAFDACAQQQRQQLGIAECTRATSQ